MAEVHQSEGEAEPPIGSNVEVGFGRTSVVVGFLGCLGEFEYFGFGGLRDFRFGFTFGGLEVARGTDAPTPDLERQSFPSCSNRSMTDLWMYPRKPCSRQSNR